MLIVEQQLRYLRVVLALIGLIYAETNGYYFISTLMGIEAATTFGYALRVALKKGHI